MPGQPETEPPGHHVDEPGGQSVDAGIRRLVLSLSVQRITPLEGQVLAFQQHVPRKLDGIPGHVPLRDIEVHVTIAYIDDMAANDRCAITSPPAIKVGGKERSVIQRSCGGPMARATRPTERPVEVHGIAKNRIGWQWEFSIKGAPIFPKMDIGDRSS